MRRLILLCGLCVAWSAQAELNIEVTGAGEHQTPIAIARFSGETPEAQGVSSVVANDLLRTGLFKMIDPLGKAPHVPAEVNYAEWPKAEALLMGSIKKLDGGNVSVKFSLLDMVRRTELQSQELVAQSEQVRAIAHRISDMVYERLTGNAGVFSTRIAYVSRENGRYRLVVADSDGYGEQSLLASNEPIMSPAWSPDGRQLAYVSFEQRRAMIFVQTLASRERKLLASFPGSNSSPAWSPDGKQLALVLTHEGNSQIYLMNSDGSNLRSLVAGEEINTEPNFSPDGKSILFTSDRGGSAQVYRVPVAGGSAERLTFEGNSNFSPRFSPDGKGFVFSHYDGGKFYIATQDFESGQMQILTSGGWDKKPSFAPNGKLILFGSESQGRVILATVSSDGKVKQKMVARSGDIREPTWGPFLKQ